jgi:hypothetical protein
MLTWTINDVMMRIRHKWCHHLDSSVEELGQGREGGQGKNISSFGSIP